MFRNSYFIPVCVMTTLLSLSLSGIAEEATTSTPATRDSTPKMNAPGGGMPMDQGQQTQMPMMMGPKGMMSPEMMKKRRQMMQQHRQHQQTMEQHLANIEALLKQLVELQKAKQEH